VRGPEALKSSPWVIRVVVEHASTDDGGSSDGVFPVDGLEVSGCTCDVFWPIGEVNEPKHIEEKGKVDLDAPKVVGSSELGVLCRGTPCFEQ